MTLNNKVNPSGGQSSPRTRERERGQILPMIAVMMGGFLCMCGFVIDVGRIYVAYNQLQSSTNAAALAGTMGLPSSSTAISNAIAYSAASSGANSGSGLSGVTMVSGYPKVACASALNLPCDGSSSYNAIQVQQTVTLPMTFAKFFGAGNAQLTATASGAPNGSPQLWNVAIIIDTTASMGGANSDTCTDPTNGKNYTTRIACALVGAKMLMLGSAPCAMSYSTCPTDGSNAVDEISLFTFPNVTYGTAADDYTGTCSTNPTIPVYSYPPSTVTSTTGYPPTSLKSGGTYPSTTPTYQVTPFLDDYRTSDTATTLNSNSTLVAAIGQTTTCKGMGTPGGDGTFFAGSIYAASAALLAEQAVPARAGSKNAIVILSDGAANSTKLATTTLTGGTVSTTASTYPSTKDQCQQAVAAANYATNSLGITIYSVAYGSTTKTGSSGDCTTDTTGGSNPGLSSCTTMMNMASNTLDFYSDYTATGGDSGCTSTRNTETGLQNIFSAISLNFKTGRLIPNSVF